MKIEISTSNYIILDSGSIIIPESEYVEFKMKDLRFRFTFAQDETLQKEGKSKVTGEVSEDAEGNLFNMTVYNFTGLFASPTQMMNVAQIEGNQISVRFSIVELPTSEAQPTRIFHYTWYQSKS